MRYVTTKAILCPEHDDHVVGYTVCRITEADGREVTEYLSFYREQADAERVADHLAKIERCDHRLRVAREA